jgi:hypothetical protein
VLVRVDVHLICAITNATWGFRSYTERSSTEPLSTEIEESSVNRVIGSGDKTGFV